MRDGEESHEVTGRESAVPMPETTSRGDNVMGEGGPIRGKERKGHHAVMREESGSDTEELEDVDTGKKWTSLE